MGRKGNKKPEQTGESFKFNFDATQNQQQLPTSVLDLTGRDAPLLAQFQRRLGSLVGKSSGYLESLPNVVQNRVKALKHLHTKRVAIETEFEKELAELEKKYEALYAPLYSRRSAIVKGESEPAPEELVEEKKEEKQEKPAEKESKKEEPKDETVKGIPEFWVETLKHHEEFGAFITDKDEEALKHLIDLKVAEVPDSQHSFSLEFYFSDNEFFEDKLIKKTYVLVKDPSDGEVMYDHVDCTEIKWKAGKNLTVKKVTKQPKKKKGTNKRGNKGPGAPITVEEPCESFFNFFNPEAAYAMMTGLNAEENDDEEEDYGLQEFLEADYEMGLELKEKVIPHAIMYFTGEYEAMDPYGEEFDEEEEQDDEENEDEEDEEHDTEYKPPADNGTQPECKQQ